ncbi:MAG: AMIN domain-containing protein, partial [Myxococcota bacterium]
EEAERRAELARLEKAKADAARAEAEKAKADRERLERMKAEVAKAESDKKADEPVKQEVAATSGVTPTSSVYASRSTAGSAADAPSDPKRKGGDDGFGGANAGSRPAPVAQGEGAEDKGDGDGGGGPRVLTFVGFKNVGEQSRVLVRTNDKVSYNVRKVGQNKVVLELENTRILLRNNQRVLDTSFFPRTAVKMVTPEEIEGASKTTRILIELSEEVPYEAKQEGNTVYIAFQRPQG